MCLKNIEMCSQNIEMCLKTLKCVSKTLKCVAVRWKRESCTGSSWRCRLFWTPVEIFHRWCHRKGRGNLGQFPAESLALLWSAIFPAAFCDVQQGGGVKGAGEEVHGPGNDDPDVCESSTEHISTSLSTSFIENISWIWLFCSWPKKRGAEWLAFSIALSSLVASSSKSTNNLLCSCLFIIFHV